MILSKIINTTKNANYSDQFRISWFNIIHPEIIIFLSDIKMYSTFLVGVDHHHEILYDSVHQILNKFCVVDHLRKGSVAQLVFLQ